MMDQAWASLMISSAASQCPLESKTDISTAEPASIGRTSAIGQKRTFACT